MRQSAIHCRKQFSSDLLQGVFAFVEIQPVDGVVSFESIQFVVRTPPEMRYSEHLSSR